MNRVSPIAGDLILLALCALACLTPMPWLSVPGAAVLLLYLPGRSLIRMLKPINTLPGQAWLAVAVSMMLMPLPLHYLWQWSNNRWSILAVLVAVNAILLLLAGRSRPFITDAPAMFSTARQRWLLAAMVTWISTCVFCVYYIPNAGGRIVPNPSGDYIKHHAVMWSLGEHPLPLHNMFYAAESDTPYYYYEQFYLMPAALRAMSNKQVSIGFAFGLVSGVGTAVFVALVFLIARGMLATVNGALLSAACASIVGGFDVVPTVIRFLCTGTKSVVMDAWSPVAWRIHNLMDDFLWCPQHVAAITTFMLCCYLARHAPRQRWWLILLPLAGASIFGTSVYQAMIVFPAAAIYLLLELYRPAGQHRMQAPRWLAAVAVIVIFGAVLMVPQALQYHEMSARYEGGLTLQWERFPLAFFGRPLPPGPLANLLDAPWMLLVDFGLGFVACVLVSRAVWSSFWRDPAMRLLVIAGTLGVATMWVIRSNVNRYDYGFRLASIPAMVVAAICVGFLLEGDKIRSFARPWWQRWHRKVLIGGVVLGLPVGMYEAPGLAFRTLFEKKPELADAAAARFVRDNLPADAVLQGDPVKRSKLAQLTDRPTGVLDPDDSHVNVFCPLAKNNMLKAYEEVQQAFMTDSPQQAYDNLQAWGVTHVFVGSWEHERFKNLQQFADPNFFEMIYNDGQAAVYRLTGPRDKTVNTQPAGTTRP